MMKRFILILSLGLMGLFIQYPPAHASTFVLMDDRPFPTLEEHWLVGLSCFSRCIKAPI